MCLTLGWIFIYVHSTGSRWKWWFILNVLRPSKCFISTLGEGIRGELKHMMAIFPGTSWLTFLKCTCLFGFYSIVSREWEKEMVPSLLRRLGWETVSHQRFVLVGMTLGSVSFATEIITITKALPWTPKARGFLQQTPRQCPTALVVMGFCCVRHCQGSTICCDSGVHF